MIDAHIENLVLQYLASMSGTADNNRLRYYVEELRQEIKDLRQQLHHTKAEGNIGR